MTAANSEAPPSQTLSNQAPHSQARAGALRLWHLLTAVVMLAAALCYIIVSLHWRIMVDSAVMHYVVFLIRHGRAPYTQISDNNMPGAYFVEALGMAVFGRSDLGWRLFEFAVLGLLTASLIDIARRWDAFAGVFAACLFLAIHSAEGPQYAAERELTLTMLLALACALLFRAIEQDQPWLLALFGLATGLAASIKPTCLPLAFGALAAGSIALYRTGKPIRAGLLYSSAGMAAVFFADVAFLVHFHAVGAFRFILQHVIPAYIGIGAPVPVPKLILSCIPRLTAPLLLVLLLIPSNLRRQGSWTWQRWTILLGAGFGFFSYIVQRKGFLHHRYTFEVFLFLLIGMEIFGALRSPGPPHVLAALALVFALFLVVPRMLYFSSNAVGHSDLEFALQSDLQDLGGPATLQDKVQCFDLVYGCLDALYHLGIVENSSFTGDLLFFPYHPSQATEYYRDRFWTGVQHDPPELIVLTNQNLQDLNSFNKLQRWPEFASWLAQNYTPVLERHFTFEHFGGRFTTPVPAPEQDAYRLYARNNSPLLHQAAGLSAKHFPGQS